MNQSLVQKLISLADRYETADFLVKDPSQFMHNYKNIKDMEVAAFIAANLAFGRRDQILAHVSAILNAAGCSPWQWIANGGFTDFFPESSKSFYRMYTFSHLRIFCKTLQDMLQKKGSIGEYFRQEYKAACTGQDKKILLSSIISQSFPASCPVVAHGKDCACKKIHMFLRWMVRNNSPVDLGLWTDWYKKADLLMPLDTHVMQQATELGLLPLTKSGKTAAASHKTAVALTDTLRQAFPDDPVRADFALFGLGVDKQPVTSVSVL